MASNNLQDVSETKSGLLNKIRDFKPEVLKHAESKDVEKKADDSEKACTMDQIPLNKLQDNKSEKKSSRKKPPTTNQLDFSRRRRGSVVNEDDARSIKDEDDLTKTPNIITTYPHNRVNQEGVNNTFSLDDIKLESKNMNQ